MRATVVISCYNQKKYIIECLESILNQCVDFEYDILISDDCSTDGTLDIVLKYELLYSEKITVVRRQENIGPEKNLIEAHKATSTDIIFHIDGDDVMLPGKLQKQFNVFKMAEFVNIVFHGALYFSDDGAYSCETELPCLFSDRVSYFKANELALWGIISVHSSFAYRRSSRRHWPDQEFTEWFLAMDSLLPLGEGAYIDEILVKYRCNLNGNSYLSSKIGRIKAYNQYFNDILYYFKNYPYLRPALYTNCLISALAMLKNRCGFSKNIPLFLLKNIYFYNLFNLKNSFLMKKSIPPKKKCIR